MKEIITAKELPEKEKIYFKKDWAGYRIVYPIKNKDGSINWLNLLFGGKRNIVFMILLLLVLGTIMFAYSHDIKQYKEVVENPCVYCSTSIETFIDTNSKLPDNFIIENAN